MTEFVQPPSNPDEPHPTEIDRAIASFREGRKRDDEALESHQDDDLIGLKPAVADAKRKFRENLSQMAKEKGNTEPYFRPRASESPSFLDSARGSIVKPIALFVAAGAFWAGSVAITESNYGSDQGQQYLEQQGYKDVKPTDTNILFVGWHGCGDSDIVQYNFDTVAPNGSPVGMMVCKGLFKAATSRQG